ncbi:MAG TPA: IclR family transcriptional regulator [Pelolinea sp.]|nr:IclR family transcriptional regulator [Pelolinea sp.]
MSDKSQSLERIVSILDCFTLEEPVLGVREAARKAGLSSSTAGRLMANMKSLGMLNQDPESQAYMMGAKVLAWAGIYTVTSDIRSISLPVMVRLQEETRETISLYVLEGNERVCVERLESPETVRIVARIGRRIPLYAGSAGKVFLAFLPDARRDEILNSIDLKPMTRRTITDLDELKSDLNKIHRRGFAVSKGEWILEAAGVAGPIFDQYGRITAALTISGPAQRFTEEKINDMVPLVKSGAEEISRDLGYINRAV